MIMGTLTFWARMLFVKNNVLFLFTGLLMTIAVVCYFLMRDAKKNNI